MSDRTYVFQNDRVAIEEHLGATDTPIYIVRCVHEGRITTTIDELLVLGGYLMLGMCPACMSMVEHGYLEEIFKNATTEYLRQQRRAADDSNAPPPELCKHGYRYMCPHGCQDAYFGAPLK